MVEQLAFWAIAILIICGIVGVLYVILKVIGVQPPPWLIQILWIILAVVIGCVAIAFLASLAGVRVGNWVR